MKDTKEKGPMEKLLHQGENLKVLATKTGIPYDTLRSYNQRKREPSLKNAIAIAKAQGVSLVIVGEAMGYDVSGLPYA